MILRKKTAQSIVEYTLIAAVVVAAMIIVASTLRSRLQNDYHDTMNTTMFQTVDSMNGTVGVFREAMRTDDDRDNK